MVKNTRGWLVVSSSPNATVAPLCRRSDKFMVTQSSRCRDVEAERQGYLKYRSRHLNEGQIYAVHCQ
ncbi:hypothetical protein TNCV_769111 [Trichonephila clavipes]|nr:hypothetical protein TNCV_769111 [Trichonephila clavipes]